MLMVLSLYLSWFECVLFKAWWIFVGGIPFKTKSSSFVAYWDTVVPENCAEVSRSPSRVLRLCLLSVANTKPRLLPSSMIMLDLIFLYCFFSDSKTLRSFSRVFLAVPAAGGKAWVKSSVFSSGNDLLFFNSSKAECGLWTKRPEKARIWNWRFSVKQMFCMFCD